MQIQPRFNEGWVLLLRGFDFGDLKQKIPKLSLVYVYGHSSLYDTVLNEKAIEKLNKPLNRQERNLLSLLEKSTFLDSEDISPEFMNVSGKEYEQEIYRGEKVFTVIEGKKVFLFPEEYQIVDPRKLFTSAENYREYTLVEEDIAWHKQVSVQNKIHYLMSRGIEKKMAKIMVAFSAKHSVWLRPGAKLQLEFLGWEPLRMFPYDLKYVEHENEQEFNRLSKIVEKRKSSGN